MMTGNNYFPCREKAHTQSKTKKGIWTTQSVVSFQLSVTCISVPWWRYQMKTFSALQALCAGNSPVIGEFPSQRPVTRSFDVFFDLCLNGQVNKREAGDFRRHRAHYDVTVVYIVIRTVVNFDFAIPIPAFSDFAIPFPIPQFIIPIPEPSITFPIPVTKWNVSTTSIHVHSIIIIKWMT